MQNFCRLFFGWDANKLANAVAADTLQYASRIELNQLFDFFNRKADALQNGAQGSGFDRFRTVHGNNGSTAEVGSMSHDDMAATLTELNKS